jgi:outer membrane protein OmpA-like peptidoglycan-associated protein
MKNWTAASLLVLALFASPATAQDQGTSETQAPAAETPADVTPAEVEIPADVLAILEGGKAYADMPAADLEDLARTARQYSKQKDLPKDIRNKLQEIAQAARAELAAREAASQNQPVTEPATPEQTAAEAPAAEPPTAEAPAAEAPAQLPAEVQALLNDSRPAADLSIEELQARTRDARSLAKVQGLPDDVRVRLQAMAKEARAELGARSKAAGQEPATETSQPQTPAVDPAAPKTEAPAVVDKQEAKELDGNVANPEAEAKARKFLADETPAEKLDDEALRLRLDGIRDLMAGNELSRETERALRNKLKKEREILRARVDEQRLAEEAKAAAEAQAAAAAKGKSDQGGTQASVQPEQKVFKKRPRGEMLRDRRASEDLSDEELSFRIEIFRDAERDASFDEDQRRFWRDTMDRDRRLLRRRMLEERSRRMADYAEGFDEEADFAIEDEYVEGRRPRRDVFAAEVDDEELEDVLVAAPRRKINRRYTIDEIEAEPRLREALPRVEIDTVHFGFNESFLREEEVENLDRIATIMERILRVKPREVFLIEGHTDAVGSDAYNLKLSRARAEAVKRALTTYFVIPARNLEAVGMGERYLKIPTADAEPENRRVSVSRATSLIGEADEE